MERAMDDPFTQSRDPKIRADRYQRLARQYFDLAKEASSPSLRAEYQHTAEDYRVRAQGELRLVEREGALVADHPRSQVGQPRGRSDTAPRPSQPSVM
jgi:hypothetical protein